MTAKELEDAKTEVQRIVDNADEGSNAQIMGRVLVKLIEAELKRVPGES